jgi:hypothetical protein
LSAAPSPPQLTGGPGWVHPEPLAGPVDTVSICLHQRRWLALRGALAALLLGLRLTVPLMLRGFVRFLQAYEHATRSPPPPLPGAPLPPPPPPVPPMARGWLYAGGLVLVSLLAIIADAASTWNTQAHSNALRMQLGAALSAKALRLRGAELSARFGAGRLLNAFSSDARRVSELNMARAGRGPGGASRCCRGSYHWNPLEALPAARPPGRAQPRQQLGPVSVPPDPPPAPPSPWPLQPPCHPSHPPLPTLTRPTAGDRVPDFGAARDGHHVRHDCP